MICWVWMDVSHLSWNQCPPMLKLEHHRWAKVSISYPSRQFTTGFLPSLAQTTQKLHTPGPQQQLTLVSLSCIRNGLCRKLSCSHSWRRLLSRPCWSLLKRRASAFVRAVANPMACCSTSVTGSILCALIAWWCTICRFCTWVPSLCTRFISQCMRGFHYHGSLPVLCWSFEPSYWTASPFWTSSL